MTWGCATMQCSTAHIILNIPFLWSVMSHCLIYFCLERRVFIHLICYVIFQHIKLYPEMFIWRCITNQVCCCHCNEMYMETKSDSSQVLALKLNKGLVEFQSQPGVSYSRGRLGSLPTEHDTCVVIEKQIRCGQQLLLFGLEEKGLVHTWFPSIQSMVMKKKIMCYFLSPTIYSTSSQKPIDFTSFWNIWLRGWVTLAVSWNWEWRQSWPEGKLPWSLDFGCSFASTATPFAHYIGHQTPVTFFPFLSNQSQWNTC